MSILREEGPRLAFVAAFAVIVFGIITLMPPLPWEMIFQVLIFFAKLIGIVVAGGLVLFLLVIALID